MLFYLWKSFPTEGSQRAARATRWNRRGAVKPAEARVPPCRCWELGRAWALVRGSCSRGQNQRGLLSGRGDVGKAAWGLWSRPRVLSAGTLSQTLIEKWNLGDHWSRPSPCADGEMDLDSRAMKGCVQVLQRLEVKFRTWAFRLLFLDSFHILVVLKYAHKFLDTLLFQK